MAAQIARHLRVGQRLAHRRIQPRHHRGRHAAWAHQRVPIGHRIARQGFRHGRRIGQQRAAAGGGRGQGAQPPTLNMWQGGAGRGAGEIHLARDDIGDQRAAAAIAHLNGLNARHGIEQAARQMPGATHAGMAIAQGIRPRPRRRQQRCEISKGLVRRADEEIENIASQADRREIHPRVKAQIAEQRGVQRQGGDGAHQQRMAIRGRAQHHLAGQIARGAGFVLHHHRLAKRGLKPGRHGPDGDIRAAAGRKADDNTNGPRRRPLRPRQPGRREPRQQRPAPHQTICRAWKSAICSAL